MSNTAQCAAIADCLTETEAVMHNTKMTILYERLSREDENIAESGSIANQKMVLEAYAQRNGLEPYYHVWDDGASGTNFQRPGWQQVLADIDSGKVGTLCCKDMSRVGRSYLEVGLFMESLREKGVRLIAVQDNVDTAKGEDDFTVFRNVINEWYARDCSRKIKSIFNAKAAEGKHISPNVPYGYYRDPEDKQKWLVDSDAAKVVQRIFQMIIEGKGIVRIAETLTAEKILNPSAHEETMGSDMRHRYSDPYKWGATEIARIIQRREYMGHTINCKTYKDSYKSKKRKKTPLDQQLVFENTHEAIVDAETWENANRLRRTIRREPKTEQEPNRLTGLLYCHECGGKMTHNRGVDRRPGHAQHNEFECSTYRKNGTCSLHYIRVPVVEEIILHTIRSVSEYVRSSEAEFAEKIREVSVLQQSTAVKDNRKKIAKAQRRQEELMQIVKKLLEANATGRIPDSHFDKMFAEYADEQDTLDKSIAEWTQQIDEYEADELKADRFIALARRYTDFDELTTTMVNEFIDRVEIYEPDRSSGKRTQRVDVYLKFIGNFTAPVEEKVLTQEQIEAERKLEKKRADSRERQRRYRERLAAKKAASEPIAVPA